MPIYNARILEVDAAETRRYAGLRKAQDFADDYDNHIVASEPPIEILGKSIVKHLDGCEKVICMAVTVGAEIEREVTRKFERGEYLASVLLDAAATAAVEQAADLMEKNFAATFAKDGFKLRWRFSPGYGDWNLTEQAKLFTISGAEQIGLNLTSAMMLEPRKSVTAIIGLEKISAQKISTHKQNCADCDKFDCPMRK